MKCNYDFTNGIRGKFVGRIAADAVFVQFDPDVSELLGGDGDLAARLRSLARLRRRKGGRRVVRSIAISPAEYRALRPVLERLGGHRVGDSVVSASAGVGAVRRKKAG